MAKQLHIEAIQSVAPIKITKPGQSHKININSPLLSDKALQSHLRIVLYYHNKRNDDDEDESVGVLATAAWMKESLGEALVEHPELAGRLRREREGEGFWEVKYNDAGVRLVQATAEVRMEEFLEEKGRSREEREEVLAYWVDVDREHPELCALFYIQVTEFQGGGYSVGISCSLLLSDPLFFTQFLKKWAATHVSKVAQLHPQKPIFHLDNFESTKSIPNHIRSTPLDPTKAQPKPKSTTTVFKFPWASHQRPRFPPTELASLSIQKAAHGKPISNLSLIVKHPNGELTVDVKPCRKNLEVVHSDVFNGDLVSWDESVGLNELAFIERSMPVLVSCCVLASGLEGIVIVMLPKDDTVDVSELIISATVFQ